MKLTGEPEAIAALKAIHKKNPSAMKTLIDDARTTTDRSTYFTDDTGAKYKITLDPSTGNLNVVRSQDT